MTPSTTSAPSPTPDAPGPGAMPAWARPVALDGAAWAIVAWSAATMALLAAWTAWAMPGQGWAALAACAVPPLITALTTRADRADRRQYLLRPLAAAMLLPILAGFHATTAEGPWGAAAVAGLVAWFLVHGLGFCMLVAWLARTATRIDSASGQSPADAAARMGQALQAMAQAEPRLQLRRGTDLQSWTLEHTTTEGRRQRIEMRIDAAAGTVRVREVASAHGIRPADERDASMRSPGDHWFDPSRPEASHVWTRSWAATMIEPQRLGAFAFDSDGSVPTPQALATATGDADALPHLLAATALRAGLHWRPTLARP